MTICIAAISEAKKIVAVTDKMLTMPLPGQTTAFEVADTNKMAHLTDQCLALFAGNSLNANEILKRLKDKIDNAPDPLTITDIAKLANDAYIDFHEEVVSNALKIKYKVDLTTFMTNQSAFDNDLVKRVNNIASNFDVGVQIIVAGVDNKPRIYSIDSGGTVAELTPFGYACIGSGAHHAQLSLIESEYSASFDKPKALYSLLEAKKRAEYDPGVGQQYDLACIDGTFKRYDNKTISKIVEVFERSRVKLNEEKLKYITEIKDTKGI